MSTEETRQLGIEFERRIQAMAPETEFLRKLDTETIYSFLNQYQDKFIHEIYKSLDGIQSGSKISARVDTILQPLYTENTLTTSTENADGTISFPLSNMGLYLKSTSTASNIYRYKSNLSNETGPWLLTNILIPQKDIEKTILDARNNFKILKHPAVALIRQGEDDKLLVIFDKFTTIDSVTVCYYKMPQHFTILGEGVDCELPSDVFDDLVSGAVQLFVMYASGKSQNSQQKQAAKSNAEDNNENNG